VVLDDTTLIPLTQALLLSWALRHGRGWHCVANAHLPVPIPVPSESTGGHRVAALCLNSKEHVQHMVAFLEPTHKLMVVTPRAISGWVQLASLQALSLRSLPGDFTLLIDPTIPHTLPPKDHF